MNFSMTRVLFSEFTAWIVFAAIGIFLVVPPNKKLRFGMDLRGGTYLTLRVQVDKAVELELIQKMQAIDKALTSKGLAPVEKNVEKEKIALKFSSVQAAHDAAAIIGEQFSKLEHELSASSITVSLPTAMRDSIQKDAVARNVDVLRLRLDRIGVAEVGIAVQGDRNIVIELPDVSDPAQARAMIGTAAQLEFRLVDSVHRSKEELLYELDDVVPMDKEILMGREEKPVYYLVNKYADITGRDIKDASPVLTSNARGSLGGSAAAVSFQLSDEGGDKFYEVTSKNIGRHLAIVLDGVVVSAPRIDSAIGSQGQISGSRSMKEAKELSLLLRSGAFGAPVSFEEERQVGPLLGTESIRQGLMSCVVSLVLLFMFSVLFYGISGIAAFMALLMNLLLILLGLRWLGATLTLPGIAGMVLTIGMAIDSSILIFERMRELVKAGASVPEAVKGGFSGTLTVILDANITHFIVGVVLYTFGTGAIQGFAATLMIGIISTLLSGLFFLRSIFNFVLNNYAVRRLSV